ncbi:MAG: hypothetical protein GXP46_07910 [Deferribacteres bacterium]|nr:hypothetical protein [Deferribacteres bacterium]
MGRPDKKFYQLIISRLDGERLSSASYRQHCAELVRKGIGGFILFGGSRYETGGFIAELQSLSRVPLFIASDIERGVGQQVQGYTVFPSQMAVAAALGRHRPGAVKILEEAVDAVAEEAIDAGINMPLIPVMDVNSNPDNPIICTRAFSGNPLDVAWYGCVYIRVLERAGLISCAKHFPGHGDTSVDSHIALPVIPKPLKELMHTDIHPFREAVRAGVGGIMVGHLAVTAVDPQLPASLSEKVITGLLREELGYSGLILTDALNMHALNEYENVPARCINAGVDILLHPADADAAAEELRHAVATGEISEAKIDRAAQRILNYKSALRRIKNPVPPDRGAHAALSGLISTMAVTLVKDRGGLLPLRDAAGACLVFCGDGDEHDLSPLRDFIGGGHRCINTRELSLPNSACNTVICALFTDIAAWKGGAGISNEQKEAVRRLIGRAQRSIVISFGSPYVLRDFAEAGVLIAAYDTGRQAQLSVIRCLTGESDFTGSLPVALGGID